MKVIIEEIDNLAEEQLVVRCRQRTRRIDDLASALRRFDETLCVKKDGRSYVIEVGAICYFDNVDDKVYCYTEDEVYETSFRLYELENRYSHTNLTRISKNMIVDASKIRSFKAQLNGRMEATLGNGERVEISRNYVAALKQKLQGIK